jgi:hypothetical protein
MGLGPPPPIGGAVGCCGGGMLDPAAIGCWPMAIGGGANIGCLAGGGPPGGALVLGALGFCMKGIGGCFWALTGGPPGGGAIP